MHHMSIFRIFYSKTPKIKNDKGKLKANSIATLEKVRIGGINQWLLIRGHDINNPILLFLHGGPGSAQIGIAYKFQRKLEKYFTVVQWDQRGAGKSFSLKIPKQSMNVEQFILDSIDLIEQLKNRFTKNKIFLVGHSWGSTLGMLLIHRYPDNFHSYIGIGQGVNQKEGEKISYEFVLNYAKKSNNKKAIKQLEKIKNKEVWDLKYLRIQRRWLTRFGGWYHGAKSNWIIVKLFFSSPEYSIIDSFKFIIGSLFSLKMMWKNAIQEINFFEQIKEVEVPVYFCVGKYDYNTPFEHLERFYNQIRAPKKDLFWFEKSAHSPNFEETSKFENIMINQILRDAFEKKKKEK